MLLHYSVLVFNAGVEVGVRHGYFSKYLLEQNPELHMTLVDSYPEYKDLEYPFTREEQDQIKDDAAKRLEVFGGRAHWHYENSLAAAQNHPDHFYDFVFIDAEHTYAAASQDIKAWHPKLRLGGLMSGHDFGMHEVQKAVKEYAGLLGRPLFHVNGPADIWYVFI